MKVITSDNRTIEIGAAETAPTVSLTDYSRRETDDFGVTTVVERGFARLMSVRVAVPFDEVDSLHRDLAALRASSTTWIVDDEFNSLSFEGFYKDLSLDLSCPPTSYCTLTVEGLAEATSFADNGSDPAASGSASTLQLLQPFEIDDAALSATSVPENDYPVWDVTATYGLGTRVIKTQTHRIYESAVAGNVGHDPAGGSGLWVDVGPTNRWAMFDQALGTATEAEDEIVVTLAPNREITGIALLDVTAGSIRVQASGYDRTLSPSSPTGIVMFLDLPGSIGATITISGSSTVSVGTLLLGRLVGLGVTEASPTAQIADYSLKETDDFGNVTVVPRAWAKRMSARSLFATEWLDMVFGRLATVRAKPSLWIGDSAVESICVYGFFRDFSIEVRENVSFLNLSIEGLSKAPKLAPIVDPGDITYADGTPIEALKPEEPGATKGATPDQVDLLEQLDQDTATAMTNIAALQSTAADLQDTADQLQGDIIAAQGDISTLYSTTATQGAAISHNADAISNTVGNLASLTTEVRAGSINLLRGGGFENGLDEWNVRAGTWFVAPASTAVYGVHAGVNNPSGGVWIEHKGAPAAAGRKYTVSGRARLSSGTAGYVCFDMLFRDAAGEVIYPAPVEGAHYPLGTEFTDTLFGVTNRQYGAVTAEAPPGTATVHARFIGWDLAGVSQIAVQQIKLEMGDKITPYTSEASVIQNSTAIAGLDVQMASLTSAVATADANASQALTAAQNAETAVGTITSEVRAGSGGNMLDNTTLDVDTSGWATTTNVTGVTFSRNIAAPDWQIPGVNNLSIQQNGRAGGDVNSYGMDFYRDVRVKGNTWYDFSALCAAHRCPVRLCITWFDGAGSVISSPHGPWTVVGTGGKARDNWSRIGLKAASPANAVTARAFLRKGDTNAGAGDSYAWFAEMQFKEVNANATSPQPYSPGTNLATSMVQQNAIATLNASMASLTSTVSTQGATITSQQTTITTLESGMATAFARVAVRLDVNGYIVGWEANNNGQTGDFTIRADKFAVVAPGGGARTEYSGGNWRVYDSNGVLRVRMGVW